jgi:hypothetical protein
VIPFAAQPAEKGALDGGQSVSHIDKGRRLLSGILRLGTL